MPLRALQREFAIADDSPDGRMLGLVAESLDYVCGLSLGARLPSEVLSGKASWEPTLEHRKRAMSIVRLQLLAWIDPEAADPARGDPILRLENEPALRQQVQHAFERSFFEAVGQAALEFFLGVFRRLRTLQPRAHAAEQ